MKAFIKRFKCFSYPALVLLFAAQIASAQTTLSAREKQIIAEFEKRAKEYVKLRERLEKRLPKLAKDATPAQIEAHKTALQKEMRNARKKAKQSEIFTPPAARLIKKILKNEFKGQERAELRQTIMDHDTKGVLLKVNAPYPEAAEQVEMPPEILLILPQLPKELRYRFVGRNLLLVDRGNELILDYMTGALP